MSLHPRESHDSSMRPPFPAQEQPAPGQTREMEPVPDHGEQSYQGHGRLRAKTALITGGDSGIGRAVAIAFAREGADVAIVYRGERETQDAEDTLRWIRQAGRRGFALRADVGSDSECRRIVSRCTHELGRIDVLVNNAAQQGKAVQRFEELEAERVEETFRTNVIGMFHLVRHALPHMRNGASVINVASIQAFQPSAAILDYASTKGAITTFTKGLSQSLLPRGIRVNCVAPGPVWTPLVVQSFPANKVSEFGKDSPLGRPAQPAELAPAFVFLASDEASYVSGEVLGVTGGKPLGS
jgi:NAD(P)-dependent dehydrogenase (short-subunit alcohol dehydrogenase family)